MTDPRLIGQFAAHFRNQDPQVYQQFLRVLDAYTADVTVAVTEATTDIKQAQGRAQQARKFLQLFSEAREPNPPSPR